MASELLIRPSYNDHRVIADLLTPGSEAILLPSSRPLISRLVVDAHVAPRRPQFAEAAREAGRPVLVDPLTPLWQGALRPEDAWARLPFGQPEELNAIDLSGLSVRVKLVADIVEFQLAQGATTIIPPYPFVSSPSDPWFDRALELIRLTARYVGENRLRLPIAPVLCASLQGFSPPQTWTAGLERFVQVAQDIGPQFIGLCLSPLDGRDSVSKVSRLFSCAQHVKRISGTRVLAWRQGFYGHGLVAAGLDGYETGIATKELCDIRGTIRNRQPPKPGQKSQGGGGQGVYLEPLGRSVPTKVAEALFAHKGIRAKVACMNRQCCPNGPTSTLSHRREHAVRARARALTSLDAMPHLSWRLHQVAKEAKASATVIGQANRVLDHAGVGQRVSSAGFVSLSSVADRLCIAEESHIRAA